MGSRAEIRSTIPIHWDCARPRTTRTIAPRSSGQTGSRAVKAAPSSTTLWASLQPVGNHRALRRSPRFGEGAARVRASRLRKSPKALDLNLVRLVARALVEILLLAPRRQRALGVACSAERRLRASPGQISHTSTTPFRNRGVAITLPITPRRLVGRAILRRGRRPRTSSCGRSNSD